MQSKNHYLIFLAFAIVALFTLLASLILIKFGLIAGITTFFGLFFLLTVYFFKAMITQLYDLLIDPPQPGKRINPFQIIAFHKVLWQYPPKGSFTFSEYLKGVPSEAKSDLDSPYEVEVPFKRKSKAGPKPFYSQEEYFTFVVQWFEAEKKGIKQNDFCRKNKIGSTRNFRKYIKLYMKRTN